MAGRIRVIQFSFMESLGSTLEIQQIKKRGYFDIFPLFFISFFFGPKMRVNSKATKRKKKRKKKEALLWPNGKFNSMFGNLKI